MELFNYRKGRTFKTVTFQGVTDADTMDVILDRAMQVAGETRDSLFGWSVKRIGQFVTVELYTD